MLPRHASGCLTKTTHSVRSLTSLVLNRTNAVQQNRRTKVARPSFVSAATRCLASALHREIWERRGKSPCSQNVLLRLRAFLVTL